MPAHSRLLGSLLVLVGTTAGADPTVKEPSAFAKGSNAFGVELYLRLKGGAGNRAFSPASVSTALAMAWGRARGEILLGLNRNICFCEKVRYLKLCSGE